MWPPFLASLQQARKQTGRLIGYLRRSRIRRSVSASVLDLVDSAWLDGDAGPARARLAAHCISALGNCHRAWPVALPPHTGRAVVRSPLGRNAVHSGLSGSLPRQVDLSPVARSSFHLVG